MLPRLQTFMTEGAGMEARGGGAGGGKGGKGLKGAGETQVQVARVQLKVLFGRLIRRSVQVEMDRRLFRRQIQKIEEEIEEVRSFPKT
jgi:hypothetical protein